MRSATMLALSLCALALAGAANAAEPSAPVALTDEQMDAVVAGSHQPENAPPSILVTTGEGVDFGDIHGEVYPPPVVIVDGVWRTVELFSRDPLASHTVLLPKENYT